VNAFLPGVLTALFLYQLPLAESHGWSAQTMATAFIGFAVARMAASLIVGPWIDRWGAVQLFPVILIPACVGLGALSFGSSPWIAFVYLALAGVSQGIASPMMTALWAEVYGVETLGATKSTVSMLGIFGTARGPLLLGSLLKAGVTFDVIIPTTAILGALSVTVSLVARGLRQPKTQPSWRPPAPR
jgi:MFS family permease